MQFLLMVTHVFDDSNFSQETFARFLQDFRKTFVRLVIYSLRHRRKHMLPVLPTIWRSGFKNFLLDCFFLEGAADITFC